MTGHFYTGEAGDPLGRHGGTFSHRRLQLVITGEGRGKIKSSEEEGEDAGPDRTGKDLNGVTVMPGGDYRRIEKINSSCVFPSTLL